MNDQLLLVSEAARRLGCSAETVRELEKRGELKATRTPGGMRIFAADDVRRLKEERNEAKR